MIAEWVRQLGYRPGWRFKLGGPGGRWLCVVASTADTLKPSTVRTTQFMWEFPAEHETWDHQAFCRWVLARLLDAERHEACEWFQFGNVRPFWPNHETGDPYAAVERW